jgi:hypothetical protein
MVLNEQQPEEVLAFKVYDGNINCPAQRLPHSSFAYPGTEEMPTRESIEIRAIICG